jgi:hypothetical protein
VHNIQQYESGRSGNRPDLDLIVWQGTQYREISANPPNHLFGVSLNNYSSSSFAPEQFKFSQAQQAQIWKYFTNHANVKTSNTGGAPK